MNFICAVEPSVFGATGIEAFEMIKGIVDKVKPDAVIAADALAAASTRRLNATIQLADTGIHPGSGVDNKRFGLTRESLGVPVVAVGIPTVVYASTIALDLMAVLEEHAPFASYFRSMRDIPLNAQRTLINQLIPDFMKDLVVSPKEADIFMADMAKTLAEGINKAVYGDIDYRHMENYLA
jgi:spore protease